MIKGLANTIRSAAGRSLVSRNRYSFYNNELPKFDPSKNYYDILGVRKDSSESEIKRAYYGLAKKYHPDSNPGLESKFKEINEAYTVLSDSKIKRQYDSARLMNGFSRKVGDKAGRGNFNYREYQYEYQSMSPEEQEQLMEEVRRKLRRVAIFGVVMLITLPFITRRNHRFYVLDQGELVPVEF
jgi:DnaJ-class molecular chaperone